MMDFFKKHKKRVTLAVATTTFLVVGLVVLADSAINHAARGKIYTTVSDIPPKKTALVLGTNKFMWDGQLNLYFLYRIDAAEALYKEGKVEFLLISGDNSQLEYSEPEEMKAALLERGIPAEHIFLDYAGFRTWDSVIRANKIFGQNDFIIVSQEFHNDRALYIAKVNGIEAIALNAQDVPIARSPGIWLRERLARVKALRDAAFNTDPRFLGEPVVIE